MRNLLITLGKDFGTDKWCIAFTNHSNTLCLYAQEGFLETAPYPGSELEADEIKQIMEFLQQTLREMEDHE